MKKPCQRASCRLKDEEEVKEEKEKEQEEEEEVVEEKKDGTESRNGKIQLLRSHQLQEHSGASFCRKH